MHPNHHPSIVQDTLQRINLQECNSLRIRLRPLRVSIRLRFSACHAERLSSRTWLRSIQERLQWPALWASNEKRHEFICEFQSHQSHDCEPFRLGNQAMVQERIAPESSRRERHYAITYSHSSCRRLKMGEATLDENKTLHGGHWPFGIYYQDPLRNRSGFVRACANACDVPAIRRCLAILLLGSDHVLQ